MPGPDPKWNSAPTGDATGEQGRGLPLREAAQQKRCEGSADGVRVAWTSVQAHTETTGIGMRTDPRS